MFFELGGVRVPVESVLDFSQSYESFGGVYRHRMASGAGAQQVQWRRLRTVLSGGGWWGAGLEGLDYGPSMTLKCAAPRTFGSASSVFVLPAARRTDTGYTPVGHALVPGSAAAAVGGGDLVPTTLEIVGDTATLATVAGAIGYQIAYWPQLTVFADPPTPDVDIPGAAHRWSLTAEEA